MIKYIYITFVVFLSFNVIQAQTSASSAGTASNLMLRFGANARISGLAESFTGLADDENALYYNPGGLSDLKIGMVSLNHTEWFEDIRIDNISFAYKMNPRFGLGAGLSHMWMPAIQGKDYLGQDTETFNVSSSIIHLGMAYKILPGLNLGLVSKYFLDKLASYSASGVAFDAGIHLRTFISGFTLGIAIQNLGAKIKYDQEAQQIPFTYRLGAAYRIYSMDLTIAADMIKSIDTDYGLNVGAEYVFQNQFSIHLGNKYFFNGTFTPSFGAGFHLKNQYHLYYTFVTFSDLGSTHRLGFAFHFNTPGTKRWKRSLQIPGVPVELRPPSYVYASMKGNQLIVTWGYVKGATYNVYARHSSQKEWKKLNKTPLGSNKLKFKKPTAKGQVYFRVTSIMNNKESIYSKEANLNVK
jgi:hypothetical protein